MSREPQTYLAQRFDPDALGQPALALQLEARHNDTEVPVHRHRKGQLVVACRGGITCTVPDGLWMVPAGFGVWIPGGIAHSNRVTANGKVCFLFVEPGAARLPSDCCTLALSPLVLELILHLSAQPQDYPHDGPLARLAGALLELLEQAPTEQLYLPLPDNRGLRRIADELTRAPGDRASMAEWARRVAMSERSLARMVRRETGMTFGQWRQQLQIIIALQQLSAGVSVQRTAELLGYESVSSFIGMFRKALGSPPGPLRARQHAAASRLNEGRRKGLAVRQLFSPRGWHSKTLLGIMPPFFLQEDQMVTHFLSESGQAACGRGDSNVNGSSDVGQVSCKTCRRTNAFVQAQENAAPASAPVTPTAAAPVIDKAAPRPKAEARPAAAQRQDRDAARKAWQARLNELSGKNRMPRSRRRAQAYL